jgi:hypothetical protein
MRLYLVLLAALFPYPCFSEVHVTPKPSTDSIVQYSILSSGEVTATVLDADGERVMLSQAQEKNVLESLVQRAKSTFCKLSVKPESVTISVSLISASWSIKDLCK